MPRTIKAIKENELVLRDGEILTIYEKKVTKYGNGAKIDAQKKYIGKRAYVVIVKN